MQIEVPSHKAKKIGITRKHISHYSLLTIGFNILAIFTFNVKTFFCLVFFLKKKKPKISKINKGEKGKKGFFSGKIINTYDQKKAKVNSGTVIFRCHPSKRLGSKDRRSIHPLSPSVPQFTHRILHWPIYSMAVLIITLNMLCVSVELL